MNPDLSSLKRKSANLKGNIENNIFEPSSGGIGIKLKIAKTRLIRTIEATGVIKVELKKPSLTNMPKNTATEIFERGPAKATIASLALEESPHLPLRL